MRVLKLKQLSVKRIYEFLVKTLLSSSFNEEEVNSDTSPSRKILKKSKVNVFQSRSGKWTVEPTGNNESSAEKMKKKKQIQLVANLKKMFDDFLVGKTFSYVRHELWQIYNNQTEERPDLCQFLSCILTAALSAWNLANTIFHPSYSVRKAISTQLKLLRLFLSCAQISMIFLSPSQHLSFPSQQKHFGPDLLLI